MTNEVNLVAPILDSTSYGLVSLNILRELDKLDVKVNIFPINGNNIQCHQQYHDVINRCLINAKYANWDATCLRIWHQHDMSSWVGRGRNVGYTIFEMDQLTDYEKHQLSACDIVYVPTKWAYNVCLRSKVRSNIKVCSLGVDSNIFKPQTIPKARDTIFLNMGKWEIRKGHDVLADYFNMAFDENDNVQLWMCNHNFFLSDEENKEWENHYLNTKMGKVGKIKMISRQETQHQIAYIMNKVDFGVFISRAEGWGLETLECMACGTPSIVTDYSGHTEFCDKENSFLINIDCLEPAVDGKWFKQGGIANSGNWAKFDEYTKLEVVELLRNCHQLKQSNSPILKAKQDACLATAKVFTWESTAKTLINSLSKNQNG